MIEITNTLVVNRHVTNAEIEQFFSDNSINITGKSLSIERDEDGRIMKIIVDATMSDFQKSLFKAEFFYTENMVEEIGRVKPYFGSSFDVPLSKNKKHLQVIFTIHKHVIFDMSIQSSIQLTFNNSRSANNNEYYTSTDGNGDSCKFNTQGSVLCNGKITISNHKNQIKSGIIDNYNSHTQNDNSISFKWKNNTDYINNINFKLDSGIKGNDTLVVVHGWD